MSASRIQVAEATSLNPNATPSPDQVEKQMRQRAEELEGSRLSCSLYAAWFWQAAVGTIPGRTLPRNYSCPLRASLVFWP